MMSYVAPDMMKLCIEQAFQCRKSSAFFANTMPIRHKSGRLDQLQPLHAKLLAWQPCQPVQHMTQQAALLSPIVD